MFQYCFLYSFLIFFHLLDVHLGDVFTFLYFSTAVNAEASENQDRAPIQTLGSVYVAYPRRLRSQDITN